MIKKLLIRCEKLGKVFLSRQRLFLILIASLLVIVGIFRLLGNFSSNFPTWLLSVWFLVVVIAKLNSRYSVIISLFFLSFCPILLIIGRGDLAEHSAIITYLFLVFSTVQIFINLVRDGSSG